MSKLNNNTTQLELLLAKVNELPEAGSGGVDTSDATATAGDLLKDKTAYVDGEKITGTIETKTSSDLTASGATVTVPSGYYATQATKSVATTTQATPTVSVDTNGKITASATQTAGYVTAGTKTGTKQLTTKGATTYTPTTTNQTISSGTYLTGTQTIKGDANLVGANIVSGKSIFGVAGTATIGTNTSDATATADEIFAGETAYTANGKVTGTFTIQDELTEQNDLIQQISTLVATKANPQGGTDTSDATATAEDILSGKTAYVKGEKITGTYEASGGGSGGGSVETCTITFDNISWDCPIAIVSAMVVENGIYQTYTNFSDTVNHLYTITIPNVVCGSEIGLGSIFDVGYGIAPYIEISGTASFNSWKHLSNVNTKFMTMTFTAPSVPNENCTISFMGNG